MNKKKGVSALFWSSADKVLTNGVAFVISICLARLIAPEDYGIIATASIFTVLTSLFIEPGLSSGLIQKKSSDRLDYSTILVFNLILGIVLYTLLFMTAPLISRWFSLPVLSSVLRVLGIQIVIGSINSVQVAFVQKNMLFKRYFICSFSSVVIGATVALVMAYKGFGVWALVAYNLTKQIINTILIYICFECRFGLNFSKERFCEMFPFAGKMLLTKFVDQGYVEATQTIIGKVFSATELAFYNKGKSFPDLLINNLNSALGSVMFPLFSNLQEDYNEFKKAMRTSVQFTSFICIPMIVGLMACTENFVKVVLTTKWVDSIPFMQLFCVYYIWIPFSNVVWQSMKARGKSDVVLLLEIIKMVLNVCTLILFLLLIQSPIAVAISIVVTYTISFFVECFMAGKYLDYHIGEIVADFVPSLVASACMGIIVLQIGHLSMTPIIELILQIILGMLIYSFIVIIFRFPQVKQLTELLKNKL